MTRTHLTMAGWGSAEITSTAILNNGTRGRRVQTESWIYSWQSKLGTFSGTDRGYVGFACATGIGSSEFWRVFFSLLCSSSEVTLALSLGLLCV